jgi:hypothetical protein
MRRRGGGASVDGSLSLSVPIPVSDSVLEGEPVVSQGTGRPPGSALLAITSSSSAAALSLSEQGHHHHRRRRFVPTLQDLLSMEANEEMFLFGNLFDAEEEEMLSLSMPTMKMMQSRSQRQVQGPGSSLLLLQNNPSFTAEYSQQGNKFPMFL